MLLLSASATIPSTCTSELIWRSFRSAATALGRLSFASASSKSIWRWRFDSSTKSRSTMRTVPTPARTKALACAVPNAPQPRITTFDCSSFSCPSAPMGEKRICREYFSEFMKGLIHCEKTPPPACKRKRYSYRAFAIIRFRQKCCGERPYQLAETNLIRHPEPFAVILAAARTSSFLSLMGESA